MERLQRLRVSLRLQSSLESRAVHRQRSATFSSALLVRSPHRFASTTNKSKPIKLEQPDKFRPPSHGSRLVTARGRGSTFNGAFNQGSTAAEQEAQKTRRYPHTFPNEGTLMHYFLTSKIWHLYIALGVLFFLAGVTWFQTFIQTSPFGHLMPTLTSFPYHPIRFFSDAIYVLKLHQDYITEKSEFSRAGNILDTQKRRIYRRAHGMEDLDRDEDQGVDVRGIVPWDDGLTKREREGGGIGANRIKMISAIKVSESDRIRGEAIAAAFDSRQSEQDMKTEMFIKRREAELGLTSEENPARVALDIRRTAQQSLGPVLPAFAQQSHQQEEEEQTQQTEQQQQQQQQQEDEPLQRPQAQSQRKRKLWFGIW